MENTETIHKYELVVIVDAASTAQQKDEVLNSVAKSIEKFDGKVINSEVWMEKQKFTFEIKNRREGTYYLVKFESDGAQNKELNQALRLNEDILRFSVIQKG